MKLSSASGQRAEAQVPAPGRRGLDSPPPWVPPLGRATRLPAASRPSVLLAVRAALRRLSPACVASSSIRPRDPDSSCSVVGTVRGAPRWSEPAPAQGRARRREDALGSRALLCVLEDRPEPCHWGLSPFIVFTFDKFPVVPGIWRPRHLEASPPSRSVLGYVILAERSSFGASSPTEQK